MTEQETELVMAVLHAAYPYFYRGASAADIDAAIKLWSMMFAADPYREVDAAVKSLIATKVEGYPPTISAVKDEIQKLHEAANGALTPQEAWALVDKATRNGYWGYKKEFDALPPLVQKAVGAPEQLKAWAKMSEETVQSVVASNFMRTYRTIEAREREDAKLPPEVHAYISALADKLALTDGSKAKK